LLAAGGAILWLGVFAWGLVGLSDDDLQTSGFVLLLVVVSLILLPLIGAGIFMILKGREELADLADVEQQRALLNLVQSRGQASINDLVLDLQTTRDAVQKSLTELVGRGLFSGYVDWNKGMLYSVEASKMRDQQTCPNCGGQMELSGKGKITCPYCGADVFLA
jgi:ribosomal protein S27AE